MLPKIFQETSFSQDVLPNVYCFKTTLKEFAQSSVYVYVWL